MVYIIIFYALQFIAAVVLIIGSWFVWDRRFKKKHGDRVPPGFERTSEISYDPTTNKKLIVYYNPTNGERYYKEE